MPSRSKPEGTIYPLGFIFEPMLEEINIEPYLERYHDDIECVSCGGESGEGPGIRTFNYGWVITTKMQCTIYKVPFRFHQTGTYFQIGKKVYTIPMEEQESQARKSGQDWDPGESSYFSI